MGKESTCNAGDAEGVGLIPRSGRSLAGGCGNPLQYSCLEDPMDRGAWHPIQFMGSWSQTRLSDQACTLAHILGISLMTKGFSFQGECYG